MAEMEKTRACHTFAIRFAFATIHFLSLSMYSFFPDVLVLELDALASLSLSLSSWQVKKGTAEGTSEAAWAQTMELNVTAPWRMAK